MTTKFILSVAPVMWDGEDDEQAHRSVHSTLESAKDWANNLFNCQSYIEVDGSYFCHIGDYECVIFQKQVEEHA
jgi:hypothetical protein